jgi:hypothetical protein
MNDVIDDQDLTLANLLRVKNKKGETVVTIGLLVTVLFDGQLTREKRTAVAEVAEEYLQLAGEHLRWATPLNGKREVPIRSPRIKPPMSWLPDHPDREGWSIDYHSGDTAKSTGEFQLEGFGSDVVKTDLGFLHMSFPLLWFSGRSFTFADYVLSVCKRLRPLSGYAGIGVIEHSDGFISDEFQPIVREIAERFPALEIESRIGHIDYLRHGIKGVNWLTVLGDRWLAEMGGVEPIRAALDDSFIFYPYEGGVVIQAGPKPQIGDVQADLWPAHYIKLAKVLKKIQVKDHGGFHNGGPNRMDKERSLAWLFRFDGREA